VRAGWPSRTFDEYIESTENYMQAIRDADDLPWFEDPERSAAMAEKLGLPTDTPALELRRTLWQRGHNQPSPVENQR
jgi:hypothetical protein